MKRILFGLSVLAAFSLPAGAAVTVTTGAGYVPVVKKVVEACQKTTQQPIRESYGGNIGQMLVQVSSGSGVNVVITDKTTLERMKTPVKFSRMQTLGTTPLMLIWKKGLVLNSPQELAADEFKRIAHPDARAAVCGRAGVEWINAQSQSFRDAVKPKLMQVSGVPQVASYVLSGEVDAGFVNYQAAMKNKEKLGGVLAIQTGYSPIEMIAAVVEGQEKDSDVAAFLKCLQSPEARKVLDKAGIR